MAKRKRLTPAEFIPAQEPSVDTETPELETKAYGVARTFTRQRPPIAQVAGEAAAASALQELADEVKQAKDDGRMIVKLPLDQVEVGYLVRDRIMADEDELQVLMKSLASRGQQTPIEVVEIGQGRYGLISGWRRLTALGRLSQETDEDRFGVVQALIRKPESAEAAYTAMVEENEIRVGLSYYERARIAAKAVEQEVFETEKAALQELFHAASRAKRSKIKSFLALYHALDVQLKFPSAISERLGGSLIRAIEQSPDFLSDIRHRLGVSDRSAPEAEVAVLEAALKRFAAKQSKTGTFGSNKYDSSKRGLTQNTAHDDGSSEQRTVPISDTLELVSSRQLLMLRGVGVTDSLRQDLEAWLLSKVSG